MSDKALCHEKCKPCEGGVAPLKGQELKDMGRRLDSEWTVSGEHHLEREYKFNDFRGALAFTNRVGEIAEKEGHHPDVYLTYGKVGLKIWTHSIDGLTENDFILAAKADEVYEK